MSDPAGLVELAAADPHRTREAAEHALTEADGPTSRVVALRALGLACKELGRLDEGLAHLHEAWRTAEATGLDYRAAQVRMSLVGLFVACGDVDAALAHADAAEAVLCGADAARLAANRAFALARGGRMAEVAAVARRALPRLRSEEDTAALVGLLVNSGLAKVYDGRLDHGEADLRAALAAARRSGLRHQAAMARHNLAFAAARRGDLPHALALYDEVEPELAGIPERVCQLDLDRAETLVAARLPGEARGVLARTIPSLRTGGYRCDLADALLLLAHAELADGLPGDAAATARRAREAFRAQERPGFTPLAEHIEVRARWAAGERTCALSVRARATARRLTEAGWTTTAADARTLAGLAALSQGRTDLAEALLAEVGAARDHGPVGARAAAWHATARLRIARGDRPGAASAVRAGLAVVDDHAAALGAAELRTRAAGWASELAELGVGLAVRPRALLTAAERARAIADRPATARPPLDRRLAGLLAELRHVTARLADVTAAGADTAPLRAAQVRIEGAVRARTRMLGSFRPTMRRGWSWLLPALTATLGDAVLVELVRVGEELHAVVLANGRCGRRYLGPYPRAWRDARLAEFAATRLAWDAEHATSGPALARATGRLDAQLFASLRLGDRPLVLVPTGALHGVPWAALPSLAGRPVTVVPSAAAWSRAMGHAQEPLDGRATVLVAGPGLAHADTEIQTVSRCHPGAHVFTGTAARAEPVREALDGTSVAHIAAHGVFRDGNALFSGVRLADGPLMAYDLQRLRRPPRLVVLSACEAGRVEAHPGEAVIGLADVLLGAGAGTVVASVTPVADAAARDLMTGFHQGLVAGRSPAEALALSPRGPDALGLTCFGAGLA